MKKSERVYDQSCCQCGSFHRCKHRKTSKKDKRTKVYPNDCAQCGSSHWCKHRE